MNGRLMFWTPLAVLAMILACVVAAIAGGDDVAWLLAVVGSLVGGLAGGATGVVLAALRQWRPAAAWLLVPVVLVTILLHHREVERAVQAVACATGLAGGAVRLGCPA